LVLLALAACGGDALSPRAVAGTYTLRTIDGQPLPYTDFPEGADSIQVVASSYTLEGGGAFTERWTRRIAARGRVTTDTYALAGTWTLVGRTVEVLYAPDTGPGGVPTGGTGGPLTGGHTITVTQSGGRVLVYRK